MATVAPERPEILTEPEGLYEVIDGQVVEKSMGVYECWLATEVFDLLNRHVKGNSLGRVLMEMIFDLRPTVDRERRPDVAFISFERWASDREVPETSSWAVVPDLAIEVVSKTNSADEIVEKVEEYFRVGVRLVWVVYRRQPGSMCTAHRRTSRCGRWARSSTAEKFCPVSAFGWSRSSGRPKGECLRTDRLPSKPIVAAFARMRVAGDPWVHPRSGERGYGLTEEDRSCCRGPSYAMLNGSEQPIRRVDDVIVGFLSAGSLVLATAAPFSRMHVRGRWSHGT